MRNPWLVTLLLVSLSLSGCRSGQTRAPQSSGFRPERRAVATLALEKSPTPIVLVVTLTPDPTALAIATAAGQIAATADAATSTAAAQLATSLARATATATVTAASGPQTTSIPTVRPPSPTATARRSSSAARQAAPASRPSATGGASSGQAAANVTTPGQPTVTPGPTEDRSVLAALRGGGFVIYLRHTQTDWSQDPREQAWVADVLASRDESLFQQCDRQRLLSDEGRNQARTIGEAFRRLGIPVGRVLTSPWCRVRDTAQLAFGRGQVATDQLWDSGYLAGEERNRYRDRLRGLLSSPPDGGTNTVLVGHMPQFYDVTGIALNEGEAVVVWPRGDDFRLLNRIPPAGWDELARLSMP